MLPFGPREDARDAFVSIAARHARLPARGRRRGHLEPAARMPAAPRLSLARDQAPARQREHAARQARGGRLRRDHPRGGGTASAWASATASASACPSRSRSRPSARACSRSSSWPPRTDLAELLAPFVDPAALAASEAERALGLVVEGSCEVPLGGHATVTGAALVLEGFLGLPDGTKLVRERAEGEAADAAKLGRALGERILARGGREVLDAPRPSCRNERGRPALGPGRGAHAPAGAVRGDRRRPRGRRAPASSSFPRSTSSPSSLRRRAARPSRPFPRRRSPSS